MTLMCGWIRKLPQNPYRIDLEFLIKISLKTGPDLISFELLMEQTNSLILKHDAAYANAFINLFQ